MGLRSISSLWTNSRPQRRPHGGIPHVARRTSVYRYRYMLAAPVAWPYSTGGAGHPASIPHRKGPALRWEARTFERAEKLDAIKL